MQLGRIRGTVVSTRKIETLTGVRLVIMEPLDSDLSVVGPPIAAIDVVHGRVGDLVYWVGSREAAMAVEPPFTAADAAIVGIVDRVDLLSERGSPA